jgi:hypothetical protein
MFGRHRWNRTDNSIDFINYPASRVTFGWLCRTHVGDNAPTMIADSTITCPHCGFAATETMPTDACQFFYDCKGCGTLLLPRPGDCCVFCSFGTVSCPPIQESGGQERCCRPC